MNIATNAAARKPSFEEIAEFAQLLAESGIIFTVDINGLTHISAAQVPEYVASPTNFIAAQLGVTPDDYREWREAMYWRRLEASHDNNPALWVKHGKPLPYPKGGQK